MEGGLQWICDQGSVSHSEGLNGPIHLSQDMLVASAVTRDPPFQDLPDEQQNFAKQQGHGLHWNM
jgi:hypothetical protein